MGLRVVARGYFDVARGYFNNTSAMSPQYKYIYIPKNWQSLFRLLTRRLPIDFQHFTRVACYSHSIILKVVRRLSWCSSSVHRAQAQVASGTLSPNPLAIKRLGSIPLEIR